MKRFLVVLCTLTLFATLLGGCSGASSSSSAAPETEPATETIAETVAETAAAASSETQAESQDVSETEASQTGQEVAGSYSIGVVQMIENGAFNDMREGFIQALREYGLDEENLQIDYQCAQGDATNLQTIVQNMAGGDYDLICTIATPATQAMVNQDSGKPVIFVAVSAPVAAGVITELDKPDKNATGTSNAIPVSDIFGLAGTLTPEAKKYGIVYCTSEVNSVNTAASAKEYLEGAQLSYEEATVTNSSEVQQAVQSLVGRVDAIFVPNDSVVMDSFSVITEISRDNRIPVYGSSATMVDAGAFATVAIGDKEIGAMSAQMAIQVLEGAQVADIPTIVVPASNTVINNQTLEALGIELSEDVKSNAIFVDDAN